MSVRPAELDDEDGENRAVRSFLMLYGGNDGSQIKIADMRRHMQRSGFDGCWPDWIDQPDNQVGLTKGGAQSWLRYLFALETL